MKVLIFGGGGMAEGIKEYVSDGKVTVDIVYPEYCDVTNVEQIATALSLYKPDVVINCAGVSYVKKVNESHVPNWIEDINVNLIGSYKVARISVEERFNIKTLIFIGSVAGLYGKPDHSSYCASKAGVISLVQSLGMEGYDAYAISPGRVDTPMRERDYPSDTPGSRLEPTDIGAVVSEIIQGIWKPGDNLIIRKEGLHNVIREVDRGQPWRRKLRVGEPVTI